MKKSPIRLDIDTDSITTPQETYGMQLPTRNHLKNAKSVSQFEMLSIQLKRNRVYNSSGNLHSRSLSRVESDDFLGKKAYGPIPETPTTRNNAFFSSRSGTSLKLLPSTVTLYKTDAARM